MSKQRSDGLLWELDLEAAGGEMERQQCERWQEFGPRGSLSYSQRAKTIFVYLFVCIKFRLLPEGQTSSIPEWP